MPMILRAVATLLLVAAATQPAAAQSCSFDISDVTFGAVDVLGGGAADTTATLSISCTGVLLTTVRICPNIGTGSGGATATQRFMQGPSTTLAYQLYQDAARTTIWGSYEWGFDPTPPTIDLPLGLSGSANTTRTIYGRVFSGQQASTQGSYASAFTAADTHFYYYDLTSLLPCSLPLLELVAHPTFDVTASIEDNCVVVADDIDFGAQGVLDGNIDANGRVEVTCTADTDYTIGLGNGLAGSGPTARVMSKGAESITYGLYKDSGRIQPWGDDVGAGTTIAATGTGFIEDITVYGRVPPQSTPSPGTYGDTVVVTVTY